MSVTVELFGIPRERAGTAKAESNGTTLGEVLADLALRFPRLSAECIAAGRLSAGYMANLNGQRFVSNPETPLQPGDALLILSTDAGG
jgi:molybdopterin converting factor small subunit